MIRRAGVIWLREWQPQLTRTSTFYSCGALYNLGMRTLVQNPKPLECKNLCYSPHVLQEGPDRETYWTAT